MFTLLDFIVFAGIIIAVVAYDRYKKNPDPDILFSDISADELLNDLEHPDAAAFDWVLINIKRSNSAFQLSCCMVLIDLFNARYPLRTDLTELLQDAIYIRETQISLLA